MRRSWDGSAAGGRAEPSMLLNRLASTSVRMQDAPETAAEELASYDARLAAAVAMHIQCSSNMPKRAAGAGQ